MIFWGFTEISDYGWVTKTNIEGLGQFCRFKGGLGKKEGGGCFEVSERYPNAHYVTGNNNINNDNNNNKTKLNTDNDNY